MGWGLVRTPGEGVFGLGSGSWVGWLVDRTGQGWDGKWILQGLSGVWLEEGEAEMGARWEEENREQKRPGRGRGD